MGRRKRSRSERSDLMRLVKKEYEELKKYAEEGKYDILFFYALWFVGIDTPFDVAIRYVKNIAQTPFFDDFNGTSEGETGRYALASLLLLKEICKTKSIRACAMKLWLK